MLHSKNSMRHRIPCRAAGSVINSVRKITKMSGDIDEAVEEALCNELVLENIFKYLPVPDLLRSSLVSKQWRRTSRRVMRKTGRCLLHLTHKPDCKNLLELSELLEDPEETVVPYVGLYISCETVLIDGKMDGAGNEDSVLNWHRFKEALMSKMSDLKFLRLDLSFHRGVEGILDILKTFSGQLRGLYLQWNWSSAAILQLDSMQFPKLEELEVPTSADLVGVINSMKSLKKITGLINPKWVQLSRKVTEDLGILKELYVYFNTNEDEHARRLAIAEKGPRLERLTISSLRYPMERLRGYMPVPYIESHKTLLKLLLRSSCDTLKYLEIELLDLAGILPNSLPILANLKSLRIVCDETTVGHDLKNCLSKINFVQYFPSLKQLEVKFHHSILPDETGIYMSSEFLEMPVLCGQYVETLLLSPADKNYLIPADSVEILSQVFTGIKNLRIKHCVGRAVLPVVFNAWQNLERIVLADTLFRDLDDNLDDIFCGPSASGLRGSSEQDSNSMPSFKNLKELRSFIIEVNHRVDTRDAKDNPGKLWLTETTGVLTFAHMPNLTLTVLRTGVESVAPEKTFNLEHLASFVKVQTRDRGIALVDL